MTELESKTQTAAGKTAVEGQFQPASWAQRFLPLFVAAIVIIFDQTTKRLIEANIPYNTSWAPFPGLAPIFQFTHTGNTGIAFGMFTGGSVIFAVVAAVVTTVILLYNYTLPAGNVGLRVVLGLLIGGALGNLIDRVRLGHVTDFLDFGPWPIFNVADTAVVLGALVMAWLMWAEARAESRAESRQQQAPVQEAVESIPSQDR
jgi:signal peptidase II